MGKLAILIYISIFSLLLILISHTPTRRLRLRHRRLRLRSNFTFNPLLHRQQHDHYIPFDPLIADIQLRREDDEWQKHSLQHSAAADSHPEWEEFINDEDRFNVTERLFWLFPKIDVDPSDGFVSAEELTRWNLQQAMNEALHRTEKEFQSHDDNRDGFVSFAEYEPPTWVLAAGNDSFGYDIGWWNEEHFNASDADGDGVLDINEFNDFLHPADSKSPKLLLWLCADVVRERDNDKDGKLNFSEFFPRIFDLVRRVDEDYSSLNWDDDELEARAKKMFSNLDKNSDGYLSTTELLPIIGKIHPPEAYYAKQQAEYIISLADSDNDGLLTLNDMIDNPFVFYSSVFSEDEMDYYPYHDEFR
ncbi:calumenin-B-like [Benincasa hispida]|uniref:calumenin-B-like n=1 Tax=Benincasa hispida TaxID=102211 RepID=UPI001902A64B|nr:calumenin-B-like [Benincasa hispida]XP_038892510.1 calumenin-B-like [Benincasa hispida]